MSVLQAVIKNHKGRKIIVDATTKLTILTANGEVYTRPAERTVYEAVWLADNGYKLYPSVSGTGRRTPTLIAVI